MPAPLMCPKPVLYRAMAGGLLLLGCAGWFFFSPRVLSELVLLAAMRGFHGRSERAALPLLLHCFTSLAILGTSAGLSFGKIFFFPLLNM